MKVLIVFSLIFVVTNATKSRDELKNIANGLLEKITLKLLDIQKIRGDLQNAADKVKEESDKIDLGISNDAHIKEMEQTFKNTEECKNLYIQKRQALKQELQNLLTEEVVKHAESIDKSTYFVENELTTIFANLQAANLEKEINACTSSNTCKLMGEYPAKINVNENVIKDFESHSRLIVDFILTTKINVQLANQIDAKVYIPVNDCLRNL